MNPILIAPCGMNCLLCMGYLREKNKCPGCRDQGKIINSKTTYCRKCIIRNCDLLWENGWDFCSPACDQYPCRRLKNLDKRYRTKYGMSMIENLEFIHDQGIDRFIDHEKARWIRDRQVYCVHKGSYYNIPE